MGKKFDFNFIPLTLDQVRAMSEEMLHRNINNFRRMIREGLRAEKDTHQYEVEFCYLEHERIMRERTKDEHQKYIRLNRNNRGTFRKTRG